MLSPFSKSVIVLWSILVSSHIAEQEQHVRSDQGPIYWPTSRRGH
jgi:hypothetical protein